MTENALAVIDKQQLTRADRPLDRNPAAVFLAGKVSAHSKRSMQQAMDKIAFLMTSGALPTRGGDYRGLCFSFPWENLRYPHTAAIRAALLESYKPASVNVMLSALRGVLKECWRLGVLDANEYQRAIDFSNVKDETLPAGRELQTGEIGALFLACNRDQGAAGIRDAAILAVLRYGLRRAEIITLDVSDYDGESGRLIVRGKGRKERTVFLPSSANEYVQRWLAVRGEHPGALFLPVNKGGNIRGEKMTSQAIYNMLGKRASEAGVKDFSPHDFRRTFAGDMLDAGADIVTVAAIMGHASVNTTARYDRRPDEAKKKAAELIHVPAPGMLF